MQLYYSTYKGSLTDYDSNKDDLFEQLWAYCDYPKLSGFKPKELEVFELIGDTTKNITDEFINYCLNQPSGMYKLTYLPGHDNKYEDLLDNINRFELDKNMLSSSELNIICKNIGTTISQLEKQGLVHEYTVREIEEE